MAAAAYKVFEEMKANDMLEMCPDGVERVPAYYQVICMDNLNILKAGTAEGENQWVSNPKTSIEGCMENAELKSKLDDPMVTLSLFKSVIYIRTAPAACWNTPAAVDEIADHVTNMAMLWDIISIRGGYIWKSIKHYATVVSGWHNAQKYETFALQYHWDRFLFSYLFFQGLSDASKDSRQNMR